MIKVVCTDRGTHPERVIGWLAPHLGEVVFSAFTRRPDRQQRPAAQRGTVAMRCPTCRRNVPLRQETAAALCNTPDLPRFDLSHWPLE